MTRSIIFNLILFQVGWFACVLGGAYNLVIPGCMLASAIIVFHLYQATNTQRELRLLSVALIIGVLYESIVTNTELAHYIHGQPVDQIAPIWIILMWPLFATTLNLSMRWLKTIPSWLVAVIGALFAPFAYYAGNKLGAVVYDDLLLSMTVIAIGWALLLPVLVLASSKFDGYATTPLKQANREHPQHV